MMRNFKKLQVWQKSITLVEIVYRISEPMPETEKYGLTSQMRRSAVSIPSNIAEGSCRESSKDYAYLLRVALGSAFELETQIYICHKLRYLKQKDFIHLDKNITEIQKMLSGLYNKVKASHR